LEFQCLTSRYNVVESNFYTAHKVSEKGYNVVDLHSHALTQSYRRNPDGIHWSPEANRGFTNLILTHLCLIMDKPLPNNVPENISLEKLKLMAKAAKGEELDARAIQKKFSDLASGAKKMTPRQQQILHELKAIEVPKPKNQAMGGLRMRPYDNRARPPRGKGPGQANVSGPQDGFGQPRIWAQDPDLQGAEAFAPPPAPQGPIQPWAARNQEQGPWGPGFQGQDRWASGPDQGNWVPRNQGPGPWVPGPPFQQRQGFPNDPWIPGQGNWGPRPNQLPGPGFGNRDFLEPPWGQGGPVNKERVRWRSGSSSGGPFSDHAQPSGQSMQDPQGSRVDWDQGRDSNQWRSGRDQERFDQGLNPIPIGTAR